MGLKMNRMEFQLLKIQWENDTFIQHLMCSSSHFYWEGVKITYMSEKPTELPL